MTLLLPLDLIKCVSVGWGGVEWGGSSNHTVGEKLGKVSHPLPQFICFTQSLSVTEQGLSRWQRPAAGIHKRLIGEQDACNISRDWKEEEDDEEGRRNGRGIQI